MIQKTITLVLVLMLVLTLVGCAAPSQKEGVSAGGPTADEEVTEDVDEVDTLTEDLDTSDLDTLDQDLEDITW